MKSKWFKLKEKAINLRKRGRSIKHVEKKLGIPRSTLSGWFKDIVLTENQKKVLSDNWRKGLILARKKAVIWHNNQKALRLKMAENEAENVLKKVNLNDSDLLESLLAILYLAEGFKKSPTTGMGNSDLLILKFFIWMLINKYRVDSKKLRCELHLRADQDPKEMKKFWSRNLKIPVSQFTQVSIDKRTKGRPTYSGYHGVCIVNCGRVAIQRKLIYLSRAICQKVIDQHSGG